MDPAVEWHPAMHLLNLNEDLRSLEDQTQDYLGLVPDTHYLDKSLIVFYRANLNDPRKTQLIQFDPQRRLRDFLKLALALSRSAFTVGEVPKYF